ncbi:MAG: 4-alpha-glucanotransferase [Verrucomicrobiaceae bacterium]|nr:MAG: 4-alpha-glucanotransferase [Verrucomicrobiaceae bacterium]
MEPTPDNKLAGILSPVSAIRGQADLGVGDTAALVEFAGWAASKGFGLVQILPVNESGSDHSPYNILSSMAYEPSTITTTPTWLPELSVEAFDEVCARHDVKALREGPVKYGAVKALKNELLETAFRVFRSRKSDRVRVRSFAKFESDHADWLEPYSLFRALVAWNGSEVTSGWPEEHLNPEAAQEWEARLPSADKKRFRDLVRFYRYVQWVARMQWKTVRAACDKLGVALVGDLPVGVSIYSADVWNSPEIFDLARSSGAPPEKVFKSDPFTEKWGQNWGFPLYNWQAMSHDNFSWWRRRLGASCEVFHFLRIDHALGFFRIYSFPWRPEENEKFTALSPVEAAALTGGRLPGFVERDDSTEENRERNRVQGDMLLRIFLEETGQHRLIAEDLGEVAPYVRPTLQALEIPGFKIPQWERNPDGTLIPGGEYQRLSLATFATHDHPPLRKFWEDWMADCGDPARRDAAIAGMNELLGFCGREDLKVPVPFSSEVHAALIRGLFACNSWMAVHQITDLLGLDERFNIPGAVGDANWTTRIAGTPSEWDSKYPAELSAAVEAIKETGRLRQGMS